MVPSAGLVWAASAAGSLQETLQESVSKSNKCPWTHKVSGCIYAFTIKTHWANQGSVTYGGCSVGGGGLLSPPTAVHHVTLAQAEGVGVKCSINFHSSPDFVFRVMRVLKFYSQHPQIMLYNLR